MGRQPEGPPRPDCGAGEDQGHYPARTAARAVVARGAVGTEARSPGHSAGRGQTWTGVTGPVSLRGSQSRDGRGARGRRAGATRTQTRVCGGGWGGVGWEEGLRTDEPRCLDPSRSRLGQGSRFSESETPGKSPGDW